MLGDHIERDGVDIEIAAFGKLAPCDKMLAGVSCSGIESIFLCSASFLRGVCSGTVQTSCD